MYGDGVIRSPGVMTSKNNTSATTSRPQRSYSTRSSTVSVTQLLSDSCSSFLNRIASRVRGPSVNLDQASRSRRSKGPNNATREKHGAVPLTPSASFAVNSEAPRSSLSSNDLSRHCNVERKLDHKYWTRSREDVTDKKWLSVPESIRSRDAAKRDFPEWKYKSFAGDHYGKSNRSLYKEGDLAAASVADMRSSKNLNSYYLGATRSRLEDKYYDVLGKSTYTTKPRQLAKSATSVILSEKAYPYVSTAASSRRGKTRDSTPYREDKTRSEHRHKSSSRRETVLYTFKPLRGEGREGTAASRHRLNSSSCKDLTRLRADSPHVSVHATKSEKRSIEKSVAVKPRVPLVPLVTIDADKTVENVQNGKTVESERVSSSASDREIKRKEIQALIEKYAGLDEQTATQELPSVLVKCQKKYSAVLSTATDLKSAVKAVSV